MIHFGRLYGSNFCSIKICTENYLTKVILKYWAFAIIWKVVSYPFANANSVMRTYVLQANVYCGSLVHIPKFAFYAVLLVRAYSLVEFSMLYVAVMRTRNINRKNNGSSCRPLLVTGLLKKTWCGGLGRQAHGSKSAKGHCFKSRPDTS